MKKTIAVGIVVIVLGMLAWGDAQRTRRHITHTREMQQIDEQRREYERQQEEQRRERQAIGLRLPSEK
jgi:hypothetical protein